MILTTPSGADVVNADACEGNGLGVERYMHDVDENPEIRQGTISASCPAGSYTVRASIRSYDNTQTAEATADFTINAPPSADATLSGLA